MDQLKGSARIDVDNRWIEVQLMVVMDLGFMAVGLYFLCLMAFNFKKRQATGEGGVKVVVFRDGVQGVLGRTGRGCL